MKNMKNEERIERISVDVKEITSLIRDLKRGREINLDCLQGKVNELGNITYALNDIVYDYESEDRLETW